MSPGNRPNVAGDAAHGPFAIRVEQDTRRSVSPSPKVESVSPTGALLTGNIVRVITFQFSPGIGTTG